MSAKYWKDLLPSTPETREYRDTNSVGIDTAKRELLREAIKAELSRFIPITSNDETLVALLRATLELIR